MNLGRSEPLPSLRDLWNWFLRGLDFGCLDKTEDELRFLDKVEFIKARTTVSFFQHVQYSIIFVSFILCVALLASYAIPNVKFSIWPALPITIFMIMSAIYPGALSYALKTMTFDAEFWRARQMHFAVRGYLCIAAGLAVFLHNSTGTAIYVTLVCWQLIFVLYAAAFSYSGKTLLYGILLNLTFMGGAIIFVSLPNERTFYMEQKYELSMIFFMGAAVSSAIAITFNWLAKRANLQALRLFEVADSLRSEKEYSDYIQDSLASGLAVVDEFGTIQRSNPAFRKEFPEITNIKQIQNYERAPDFTIETSLQKQTAFKALSEREFLVDGKKFLRKADAPGAIYVFTDITQQNAAERLNFQSQKMNAIGSMASRITHDFNNHLAVIQSNAEIIGINTPKNSDNQAYITTIIHSCESAAALTRHLLSYARAHPEARKKVDVKAALERVKLLLSSTLGKTYHLHINCQRDCAVFVDAVMFESALLNLVVNSAAAMQNGGQIDLGAWIEKDIAHIYVADQGEGIPAELLEDVKKPFFTTKPHDSGSGLGLAAVVQFAERNDGKFDLQSELHKGTKATLSLKIYDDRDNPSTITANPLSEGKASAPQTILIVDDNLKLLQSCSTQLEAFGHNVMTAQNIKDIPKTLETIDLVLCDVVLKNENAIDVLDLFRKQDLTTRFVFISGNLPEKLHQDLQSRGETAFLQKPVTINELIQCIEMH